MTFSAWLHGRQPERIEFGSYVSAVEPLNASCVVLGNGDRSSELGMTIKILVVKDEPLLQMAAVNLVEDAGFEALEAADGEEPLALLEAVSDIRF